MATILVSTKPDRRDAEILGRATEESVTDASTFRAERAIAYADLYVEHGIQLVEEDDAIVIRFRGIDMAGCVAWREDGLWMCNDEEVRDVVGRLSGVDLRPVAIHTES